MKNNELNKQIYLPTNIKFLRISKNLSQKQLGTVFGYSDTTISNWEKGTRIPESLDLPRIASYFNVNIDDLMSKDLRFNNQKVSTISEVKNNISNLSEEDMNKQSKESLINMVDTLHYISKNNKGGGL